MSKRIQAYFRTEDEAEGARTSLQVYATEQLEVGALESAIGRERHILLPFVPNSAGSGAASGTGGVGVTGTGGSAQGLPIVPVITDEDPKEVVSADVNGNREGGILNAEDVSSADLGDLRYVLSCKVNDEEYNDVVNKIRQNGGYVESFE
ncbi:hypothetical protein QPK24_18905 [Paenibacillus polygoni]|uniref:Uncharacterized protein n=1 Tax=Paenibacillus polygoni TaxID=3050112 RepID=A0ABY8WZ15_9BACL|nr:hypothetical protein [Paenibacillus polygoni]WIV18437.1 hypothetical protein QPK24_18905 [Paenibacillus polygoni]